MKQLILVILALLLFIIVTPAVSDDETEARALLDSLIEKGDYAQALLVLEEMAWQEGEPPLSGQARANYSERVLEAIKSEEEKLVVELQALNEKPSPGGMEEKPLQIRLDQLGNVRHQLGMFQSDYKTWEPGVLVILRLKSDLKLAIQDGNKDKTIDWIAGIPDFFPDFSEATVSFYGVDESGIPYVAKKGAAFARLIGEAEIRFGETGEFTEALAAIEFEILDGNAIPDDVEFRSIYVQDLRELYGQELARLESPPEPEKEPEASATGALVAFAGDTEDTLSPTESMPDIDFEDFDTSPPPEERYGTPPPAELTPEKVTTGNGEEKYQENLAEEGIATAKLESPPEPEPEPEKGTVIAAAETTPSTSSEIIDITGEHAKDLDQPAEGAGEAGIGDETADASTEGTPEITFEDSESEVAPSEEGAEVDEVPGTTPEDSEPGVAFSEKGAEVDEVSDQVLKEDQETASTTLSDTDTREVITSELPFDRAENFLRLGIGDKYEVVDEIAQKESWDEEDYKILFLSLGLSDDPADELAVKTWDLVCKRFRSSLENERGMILGRLEDFRKERNRTFDSRRADFLIRYLSSI